MPLEVVFLVLFGAALHAGWNALLKAESDNLLNTTLIVAGSAVVAGVFLPFVPFPLPACRPYLAASVLIHILYFIFLIMAYKRGDMSLVYPLMRGIPPVLTAVAAAFLFNEMLAWKGWLGVLLVSGGALLLAADHRLSQGFRLAPIVIALANALVIVIYTLVDGQGARLSGHAFSYTGWMLFLTACLFFLALPAIYGYQVLFGVAKAWRKSLIGGGCTFASYGIALWAMTVVPIALVAALRETSILFGVALAVFTLKERLTRLRLLSVALITAGVVAIKLS
ncbi:MAG: SMR family transporter [Syntrophales bacterium]|nr:SMR family transporter [Syntrophales bacterium]